MYLMLNLQVWISEPRYKHCYWHTNIQSKLQDKDLDGNIQSKFPNTKISVLSKFQDKDFDANIQITFQEWET